MKYLLLSLLQEPLTLPEILRSIKGDRNQVNITLLRLMKKGYVDRIGSKRNYRYFITSKGLLKYYSMKIGRLLGGEDNE